MFKGVIVHQSSDEFSLRRMVRLSDKQPYLPEFFLGFQISFLFCEFNFIFCVSQGVVSLEPLFIYS